MNKLSGRIAAIDRSDSLLLIKVEVAGVLFTSLVIEDAAVSYAVGDAVHLLFKETEVLLATPESRISAKNAVIASITAIEEGVLLSHIHFEFHGASIGAIITKEAARDLGCAVGASMMWCVKSNETALQKGH